VPSAESNKSRPFCSPRCKLIDLDKWLSGSYRVPDLSVDSSEMGEIDPLYEFKGDEEP